MLAVTYVDPLYTTFICYWWHMSPENDHFEFHGSIAAKWIEINTIFFDVNSKKEALYTSHFRHDVWSFYGVCMMFKSKQFYHQIFTSNPVISSTTWTNIPKHVGFISYHEANINGRSFTFWIKALAGITKHTMLTKMLQICKWNKYYKNSSTVYMCPCMSTKSTLVKWSHHKRYKARQNV